MKKIYSGSKLVENDQPGEVICPHLGLQIDRRTSMNYPAPQNYCHNVKPLAAPKLDHQMKYCLSSAHINCKLYQNAKKVRMPANLSLPNQSTRRTLKLAAKVVGSLFLVLVLLVAAWQIFFPDLFTPPAVQPQVFTATITATQPMPSSTPEQQSPTVTASLMPSPTATPTLEPTPTLTPTRQPPHFLEIPFGAQEQFVLHKVVSGEYLNLIAKNYNTTPEAIEKINFDFFLPLNVGVVLIIPHNQIDVSDVTPMTAYEITEEGITLRDFAYQNGAYIDALSELNDLPPEYIFSPGEWVLVPYSLDY